MITIMDLSTKKDLKISLLIGLIAGILLLPILPNIAPNLDLSSAKKLLAVSSLALLTLFGYLVAYWLSKWFPVMIQFVKFGITGGLNALIYLGVLNLLISATKIAVGFYYSLFVSIAFIVAVTNSYIWNKYWVFKASESGGGGGEFVKFFAVNLVGFLINVGSASFVVNVIGAPTGIPEALWANIGAVSAVFLTLFWNFIGLKFIVFKK